MNLPKLLKCIEDETPEGIIVQFFNANTIATWEHLYFATFNALVAFKQQYNRSRTLSVEILLYASTQHQIKKAISGLGVHKGTSDLALIVVGKNNQDLTLTFSLISKLVKVHPDETVLEISREKKGHIQRLYGISTKTLQTNMKNGNETQTLTDLIIEKMALLSIMR